eukprot:gene6170-9213_t
MGEFRILAVRHHKTVISIPTRRHTCILRVLAFTLAGAAVRLPLPYQFLLDSRLPSASSMRPALCLYICVPGCEAVEQHFFYCCVSTLRGCGTRGAAHITKLNKSG